MTYTVTLPIDTFIALNGDLNTIPKHFLLAADNLDVSAVNKSLHKIEVEEITEGEVVNRIEYGRQVLIQMYNVKYIKNGKVVEKSCAGHLLSVKSDMVLHRSYTK